MAIKKLAEAFEYLAIASLAVLATLILVQVILRNTLAIAIAGLDEIARLAHINLVYLVVPLLFRENQHVNIDIFPNWLGPPRRLFLAIIIDVLTVGFGIVFLISSALFLAKNASVRSPALGIPNSLFFAGAYLGIALLAVTAIEQTVHKLHRWGGQS